MHQAGEILLHRVPVRRQHPAVEVSPLLHPLDNADVFLVQVVPVLDHVLPRTVEEAVLEGLRFA